MSRDSPQLAAKLLRLPQETSTPTLANESLMKSPQHVLLPYKRHPENQLDEFSINHRILPPGDVTMSTNSTKFSSYLESLPKPGYN